MKTYWPVFRPSGLVLAAVMLVPHWTGAQTAKSATAEASSESAVAQVDVDRVDANAGLRFNPIHLLSRKDQHAPLRTRMFQRQAHDL